MCTHIHNTPRRLPVFSIGCLSCIVTLPSSEVSRFMDRETAKFSNLPTCSCSFYIFLAFSLLNKSRSYQSFEHINVFTYIHVYLQKKINLNKDKFILAPSVMVYSYVDGMQKEKTLFLAYNKVFRFNSPADILTYLYLHNTNTVITCIHSCTYIPTHSHICIYTHSHVGMLKSKELQDPVLPGVLSGA